MREKVKIGILGCANIAKRYAIKAFQSLENAEVALIASRDYQKAKEWASEFGIGADQSYDALVKNKDVDVIYIPLPTGLHKEWILKAAQNGKHVLCEKSLAGDLSSVKEIIVECKKNDIVLYENFMCDFHPQHRQVLSVIQKGEIGEPFVFRGYFGFPMMQEDSFRYDKDLGGGSLNDAGAYTVFMARKMFGEPSSVSATLSFDEKKGIDMRGAALLEFPAEKTAFVAFSFDSVYQNNYSIWGAKGVVNVKRAYSIPPDMKPEIEVVTNENNKETVTALDTPAANHFELIFSDFCDTVLNKKDRSEKIQETYAEIEAQARALEAIRLSSKENKRVHLSEIS